MATHRWFAAASWTCLLLVTVLGGCGGGDSSGGGGPATPAPTANATADATVPVGSPVTLDGSASDSPTGTPLSYQWALTGKPAGSSASLSTPNSVRSTFTPDVAGTYTGTLVVRANGVDSQPDAVSITAVTGNVPPVANAGQDRSAAPNGAIILDGTASRDPNKTTITYTWRIVEQPSGSHPTLTNATSATPTFTADVPGRYVLALTCSDGTLTSTVDEVVIIVATGNLPPVANAGADQTVTAGQQVTLDGTRSTDPNSDPLTYSWCIKGRPEGSTATLSAANVARPTFTPDVGGSYVFCLTVNDGKLGSDADTVVVEARAPSSGTGALQAYVKPSNTTLFPDLLTFGRALAMDGDTLAVSAIEPSCATGVNGNQTDRGCPRAGAVYVYTRTGGTWSQQAYLKPSNTLPGDGFGTSISLSGDTLAIGAPDRSLNGVVQAGVVYIFTRNGSTWSQQAQVSLPSPEIGSRFGKALAVSGNTLAASAVNSVFIFARSNEAWTSQGTVYASNMKDQPLDQEGVLNFGSGVALDGDTLAVAAVYEPGCSTGVNGNQVSIGCTSAGAVYVFTRTAGVWNQQAYVKASNTDPGDLFGQSLALKGDTLIVGASVEASCAHGINGNQADNGCPGAGAVYTFARTNNVWSQFAYVKPIPPGQSFAQAFGARLAFDGTTLAVGGGDDNCARGFNPAPGSSDCFASGVVYLFTRTATSWAQRAYVKASNPDGWDFFGMGGIAIGGNTLSVGAPSEDSCATGINGDQTDNNCGPNPDPDPEINHLTTGSGAVYVYVLQ